MKLVDKLSAIIEEADRAMNGGKGGQLLREWKHSETIRAAIDRIEAADAIIVSKWRSNKAREDAMYEYRKRVVREQDGE